MGINVCKYPYFLCLDADSVLQHDSLEKIVRPVLEDSTVVAVGGTVRPCNGAEIENGRVIRYRMPRKLLACMQVLEYDRSFLASRILFDRFNGNIIISGAFGLFLKSVVIAAGGYDSTTMGEDMELVVKLHVYCRGERPALPHPLRQRRGVLVPGARAPGGPVPPAAAVAHRPVPEHDQAQEDPGQSQVRRRQLHLLLLFPALRAVLPLYRGIRGAHHAAGLCRGFDQRPPSWCSSSASM